jgi:hypothetical protein
MVVTDIQICFSVGALFADLAAPAILANTSASSFRESPIYARLRRRILMYPALVLGPSATLFMLSWPGWESQYLGQAFEATDSSPWHASLFALFLFLLVVAAWFGNRLGFAWVLAGARARLRAVYGSVLVGTIILVLARWPALVRLGAYADFARDAEALPYIWQDTTFFVWLCVLTAYCAVPLGVLGWQAYRETASLRNGTSCAEPVSLSTATESAE